MSHKCLIFCFSLTKIDDLLMKLYSLYHRSPKKWRELKAIGEELEEHVVKPARSQGTRWIDHRRRAVSCLATTNYRSIVTHHQERQDEATPEKEKISAMLRQLTSPKLVLNMALYQDLLSDLAELSLNFQGNQLPLSCVRSRILAAQAALRKQTQKPGLYLRPVLESFTTTTEGFQYNGVNIRNSNITAEAFCRHRKDTVDNIIACIGKRFSTFSTDPVLLAAKVFDPVNFPTEEKLLEEFGEEELHHLCKHFEPLLTKNGCNVAEIDREWFRAKADIVHHHKYQTFLPLWSRFLMEKGNMYPNLLHLVRIILVFPVSTSQVERQFSIMKRMQGDWRLSLHTSTIEDLLLIKAQGCAPADFQSQESMARWWAAGINKKRPNIHPYGPRNLRTHAETLPDSPSPSSNDSD